MQLLLYPSYLLIDSNMYSRFFVVESGGFGREWESYQNTIICRAVEGKAQTLEYESVDEDYWILGQEAEIICFKFVSVLHLPHLQRFIVCNIQSIIIMWFALRFGNFRIQDGRLGWKRSYGSLNLYSVGELFNVLFSCPVFACRRPCRSTSPCRPSVTSYPHYPASSPSSRIGTTNSPCWCRTPSAGTPRPSCSSTSHPPITTWMNPLFHWRMYMYIII